MIDNKLSTFNQFYKYLGIYSLINKNDESYSAVEEIQRNQNITPIIQTIYKQACLYMDLQITINR